MSRVFSMLHYSKQAFHQKRKRQGCKREAHELLVPTIKALRLEHPGVAARQLYRILQPANIGRDRFEQLAFAHGLRLSRRRAAHRTTNSSGVIRFPNLVEGRTFTSINQAWASDITYYQSAGKCYYLTFIVDLYSRTIVGESSGERLLTEDTTLPALQMAVAARRPGPGLIFHSDGGGQYYSKEFIALTQKHKMHNSMCDMAYENPYAERINGTIKNQYLKGYNPLSLQALNKAMKRAVANYNNKRPHSSLQYLSPMSYEATLPKTYPSLKALIFATVVTSPHDIRKIIAFNKGK